MRLIDADALKKDLRESYEELVKIYDGLEHPNDRAICGGQLSTFLECIMRVRNAPTIEAEPVKHGCWVGTADGYADGELVYDIWECSECGYDADGADEKPNWNYCPNCGAKMDGGA